MAIVGATVRVAGTECRFEAPEGEDLLEVLQSHGFPIATSCGGVAACGLCRITIEEGRELLSPIRDEEAHHLGSEGLILGTRLACQSKICGAGASETAELVVRVPQEIAV
jgi:2Fe-2S ferredoxin